MNPFFRTQSKQEVGQLKSNQYLINTKSSILFVLNYIAKRI